VAATMSESNTGPEAREARVRVTEIFHSLQGESRPSGLPTAFIRLTGCPLRCKFCDTEYAFHGGRQTALADILEQIAAYGTTHVCVTGGEPLAQPGCIGLLTLLCDSDYEVSLETSGALDIADVDPRVTIVMDLKTPGSGESSRNRWENLGRLKPDDQIKFVICDRDDYEWAKQVVTERELATRCAVLFSPSWGRNMDRALAEWILEDRLAVRFQIQLHKVIWGDVPGR
jgi:7-carboxy-7-deazaguanine synthase